jgi:hypothetical protein
MVAYGESNGQLLCLVNVTTLTRSRWEVADMGVRNAPNETALYFTRRFEAERCVYEGDLGGSTTCCVLLCKQSGCVTGAGGLVRQSRVSSEVSGGVNEAEVNVRVCHVHGGQLTTTRLRRSQETEKEV